MADEQEKTEDPTGKKLTDAKNEGNVAKSRELPAAVTLLLVTFFFYYYGPYLMHGLARLIREIFMMTNYEINTQSAHKIMLFSIIESAKLLAPFMALVLVVGVASNVLQTGFMFTPKALSAKLERIDPIKGFGRFFSKKSLVELMKSLFKVFVVTYVAYLIVKKHIVTIISMADMDFYDIFSVFGKIVYEIMWKVSLLALFMALADFIFQKYQFKQDLKMSKHEVKEERKQAEGDPHVKGRIRSIQREMARKRMMDDVPKSDVVVTNPTHFAVALKYSPGEDRAPVVMAKGQRLMALRIKEIAKQSGILVHEDPPIARSLFKTVDIGDEIPENLYKAVAEILALVDKFKRPTR
ncbi:flagellar biosynthetic protein FlhB [Denitrovibrio acetiphilus DSM 12809]|uniref:Flagellar biosynthetic protein FlhB n=1 Tax=Denitrovibrio acetiphilus (strain DSM 12809 / NBRC 114555 / N2460) TaxID=522772 RepID=D4H6B9_DENA2|nr:flagellar biosynthesis protein FlhB [Denitrovibrio acetiphilus]ADD69593.1 flagellar biosynthetic protein FlhB [Denitrovibrio acetiphilus DSM 12809]